MIGSVQLSIAKATFLKISHLLLLCTFLILSYKKGIFSFSPLVDEDNVQTFVCIAEWQIPSIEQAIEKSALTMLIAPGHPLFC